MKFLALLALSELITARKCRNGGKQVFPGSEQKLCYSCKNGSIGNACQKCPLESYLKNKSCIECNCNAKFSLGSCSKKGRCRCLPGYGGKKCNRCAKGFTGYPRCHPENEESMCYCDLRTSLSVCPHEKTRRCMCKSTAFGGKYCEKCAPGHVNFPECTKVTKEGKQLKESDILLNKAFYQQAIDVELLDRTVRQSLRYGSQDLPNENDRRQLHELRVKYTSID